MPAVLRLLFESLFDFARNPEVLIPPGAPKLTGGRNGRGHHRERDFSLAEYQDPGMRPVLANEPTRLFKFDR